MLRQIPVNQVPPGHHRDGRGRIWMDSNLSSRCTFEGVDLESRRRKHDLAFTTPWILSRN